VQSPKWAAFARASYGVSGVFAVGCIAWIVYTAVADVLCGVWLGVAVGWFSVARQADRRAQFDGELPEAEPGVLTLVEQGRNIEAIKHYRELHPGVGLREAKHVVDRLKPGTDRSGTPSA
jgi:MFS superfamily sulfate permease-like transporter